MRKLLPALPWAIAMFAIAIAEHYGLIERQPAQTMFAILPALAVVAIVGGTCRAKDRAA